MIDGNLLAQLFPLLILLVIGFALVLIWLLWITSRRGKRKGQEQAESQTAPKSGGGWLDGLLGNAGSNNTHPSPAAPSIDGDTVEVFRVLRDLTDGSLVIEIDGMPYTRLVDITDGQVGRRFVANAQALAHFAMLVKGEAPPPPAPTPVQPRVTQAAAVPVPSPAPNAHPPADGGGPRSVADEIEDLLQYRLSSHPQLANRSIHVRPGLGGGVRIVVDDKSYGGVDEVPDTQIRDFIQETIHQWNARN